MSHNEPQKSQIKTYPYIYCSVFDDLGADRKLRFRAVDRRHGRQKRSIIRSINDHVLIRIFCYRRVAHCGLSDAPEYSYLVARVQKGDWGILRLLS